jgi:hypothetical protein
MVLGILFGAQGILLMFQRILLMVQRILHMEQRIIHRVLRILHMVQGILHIVPAGVDTIHDTGNATFNQWLYMPQLLLQTSLYCTEVTKSRLLDHRKENMGRLNLPGTLNSMLLLQQKYIFL